MKFSRVVTIYNQWAYLEWLRDDRLFNTDTEYILLDDASAVVMPPEVGALARRRGIRVIRLPANSGRCVARNTGAAAATGEYIDFIDGDDLPLPLMAESAWEKAELVSFPFEVHGNAQDMRTSYVRHPLLVEPRAPEGFIDPRPAAILWKRNSFLQLGGFAAQWEVFEDVDLLLRAQELPRGFATHPKQSYNEQSRPYPSSIASHAAQIRYYSRLPSDLPVRDALLVGSLRTLWVQTTWALLGHGQSAYLFRNALSLLWNLFKRLPWTKSLRHVAQTNRSATP